MLSTFFSTSRPIHYLMIFLWIVVTILIYTFLQPDIDWWSLSSILIITASLAVYEFIISKNDLTPGSSYALWIASVLTLLFLKFNVPLQNLISLLFVLLALRKLLSLKSDQDIIKKVFDAAFWVSVATVFYHWSAVFYIVVFIAIFLYVRNDYRNWIVPFIALGALWMLLFTYDYVWDDQVLFNVWSSFKLSYLWEQSFVSGIEVILLVLILTAVLGLLVYVSKLIDIQQSVRPRFSIITFAGLCAIVIAILDFSSFKVGGFLLLIPALALFMARMAHAINHKIVIELILWFPLALLVLSFLLP